MHTGTQKWKTQPTSHYRASNLWLIAIACLCAMIVVGCATQNSSGAIQPTPALLSAQQPPTTLIFWHTWSGSDQYVLGELVEHYNQIQTNTQIRLHAKPLASLSNDLVAATKAGEEPHLVLLQNHIIGRLVEDNILLPLDDLVEPSLYNTLLPAAVEGAKGTALDGKTHLYGLPLTFDTLALYYEGSGETDEQFASFENVLTRAYTLTDNATQPPLWGLAYTLSFDKTSPYLEAFGGQLFDANQDFILGKKGRAGTEQWLQWLQTLYHDKRILAVSDSIEVNRALKAHHARMTIDWAHQLSHYQALWGKDMHVALLPIIQSLGKPAQPYVQSYVVTITAKVIQWQEQQATLDFLRFLLKEESQQILLEAGKQPVQLNLDLSEEHAREHYAHIFRKQALQGRPMPNNRLFNEIVRGEIERMQLVVLRGLKTPTDAISDAEASLREHIKERTP